MKRHNGLARTIKQKAGEKNRETGVRRARRRKRDKNENAVRARPEPVNSGAPGGKSKRNDGGTRVSKKC